MLDRYVNLSFAIKNWYYILSKKIFLTSVTIQNRKLAEEIEQECERRSGYLTYGEFARVDQYGKNGYHARSEKYGFTDVWKRWGVALAQYCYENDLHDVIEFGCGSGELGAELSKVYKKLSGENLLWTGVEINTELHDKVRKNFTTAKAEESLDGIATSINDLPKDKKYLIVFPYSLDSIPPEVFLNTKENVSYPDSLLGITVKNGVLQETIIPDYDLRKKGIYFKNGIYKSQHTQAFDLKTWKIRKGQRAYIPVAAFSEFLKYVEQITSESTYIIIDEFRNNPFYTHAGFLGLAKNLYKKNLECSDIAGNYKNAGNNLFYYPFYFDTFYKFLHTAGFRSISYEIEQKSAAELTGKKWVRAKERYFTQVFIAKNNDGKRSEVLPIVCFKRKMV